MFKVANCDLKGGGEAHEVSFASGNVGNTNLTIYVIAV